MPLQYNAVLLAWFYVYSSSLVAAFPAFCAHQIDLTSLERLAAKSVIQMLTAAHADLIGQPLSSAAKSGTASLIALAHRVAT